MSVTPTPVQPALTPLNAAFVGAVAALSGVLFGFDASIAASVGSAVNAHFNLVNPGDIGSTFLGGMWGLFSNPAVYGQFLQGLWVGMVPLGALFGALCGGYVANKFGRKTGLLFNACLFLVGIVISLLSPSFGVFLFSRLLMGLAIGNSAVITPMYMAEVAPPASRGRILFMYQLSIVIGILLSFLVGVLVNAVVTREFLESCMGLIGLAGNSALTDPSNMDWRIMLAVGVIPAVLFLFGMFRMPRSPRWLVSQGRYEEAHIILRRMVGEANAQETLDEIKANALRKSDGEAGIRGIFTRIIFPVVLLGFFLQFFQQATGINATMYFGPQIFQEGGFSPDASMWAQVAMGAVNLVATVVSIFLVDKLGRRRLMFVGVSGIVVMLLVQAALFQRYTREAGARASLQSNPHEIISSQPDMMPLQPRNRVHGARSATGHGNAAEPLTLPTPVTNANRAANAGSSSDSAALVSTPAATGSAPAAATASGGASATSVPATGDTSGADTTATALAAPAANALGEPSAAVAAAGAAVEADLSAPAASTHSRTLTYLIFASVLVYIVFFAISAGPLCWLMISEVFPIRYRGIGMSIAVAANWFVDYLVTQLFPLMKENLGIPATFLSYAVCTAVALVLAYRFLPETKGVALEKIEENIYAGKRLRDIGA